MISLGIDIGTSTLKLVVMADGLIKEKYLTIHHGRIKEAMSEGLKALELSETAQLGLCVTGTNADSFLSYFKNAKQLGDIPAIVEGVRYLAPEAGSVIEIGSQGARFITGLQNKAPDFATNEHCAGGTGSFFEDQMSRLGCRLEDYSNLVDQAKSIPRLSGRCSVFAKTDIIHRQQEGASTPDILLGLCYAMIRNYKATIVRRLQVSRPVVFCGGVTCNRGVVRAIKDVFELQNNQLIIPHDARYEGAIGAAIKAEGEYTIRQLVSALEEETDQRKIAFDLPRLVLRPNTSLLEPKATGLIPESGAALGIDIGSTSTDLVLIGKDGSLIDYQYLRTAGDPEGAVRRGLASIRDRFGQVNFTAVGVTGSGRERVGKRIGADAIRDEITAQARGAVYAVPEVDTVFEIGGQDSKYISIKDGSVVDFQMNKICAAGTGSFIEEQAIRMDIPLAKFGQMALLAKAPAVLGERCTVFIETAIASAMAENLPQEDIAAGLCHSIVRNYLNKVVGTKPVGQHIVLQGGVNYNPGIVAAFQSVYKDRVQVSPYFSISGAVGAALLAQEEVGEKASSFVGFDSPAQEEDDRKTAEIQKNIDFYRQANKLLLKGYTGKIDPAKKTVGVPFVLMIHKFFPMANAFFTSLGYNVVLTNPTDEETIRLSQLKAQGETCYPVKLIYGHMQQLIDMKVDYIFLPTIHTMKHEKSQVAHNYGCVYMQTAAVSVAKALDIKSKGITLLSPVFDLDFGQQAMAKAMLGLSKILGQPKPLCAKALLAGAMAVRKHTAAVEEQGKALLSTLKPEDKVLVLITRNYGISDPILNMGIPELLLKRGYKVITLSHLPAHDLDLHEEYDNLYYPFGQHIISGAKLIAHHPNLYAVYLTNHGCGPDTMLSHLFKQEMGDKPYLQIEVDEHFSNVGVITRIEAFLNSLKQRPAEKLPEDFNLQQVEIRPDTMLRSPANNRPLFIQNMGYYSNYLAAYYRSFGIDARILDKVDDRALSLGRAYTSAKEYLPFPAMLGAILANEKVLDRPGTYLIFQTQGAEADGLYAKVINGILAQKNDQIRLVAPMLEIVPEEAAREALIRALIAGDLVYAAPLQIREEIVAKLQDLPDWDTLHAAAKKIGEFVSSGKRLSAVGNVMCITTLDSKVLEKLEQESNHIIRSPFSEAMVFLWRDNLDENKASEKWLNEISQRLEALGKALGTNNCFADNMDSLFDIAGEALPQFAGGFGRYRFAKAVDMSAMTDAVLTLAPRYENTAMILEMRNLNMACQAPLFSISLDNDWDETASSRLRSFLYYC